MGMERLDKRSSGRYSHSKVKPNIQSLYILGRVNLTFLSFPRFNYVRILEMALKGHRFFLYHICCKLLPLVHITAPVFITL